MLHEKEIALLIADALSNTAQIIYDGLTDVKDEQPKQGADAMDVVEVSPDVVTAVIDTVKAAEVAEKKSEVINDVYRTTDVVQNNYDERLRKALEILKGEHK